MEASELTQHLDHRRVNRRHQLLERLPYTTDPDRAEEVLQVKGQHPPRAQMRSACGYDASSGEVSVRMAMGHPVAHQETREHSLHLFEIA
jgi:hypothetical protein